LISIGLFSSVCYSIWLVNKLLFGNIKGHLWTYDLSEREILVLIPFILYVFLFGVSPFILNYFLLVNQKLLSLFIIVI
jgi:NADH:ubiquinone oxidoreductase subunit 4 (subunit M)